MKKQTKVILSVVILAISFFIVKNIFFDNFVLGVVIFFIFFTFLLFQFFTFSFNFPFWRYGYALAVWAR